MKGNNRKWQIAKVILIGLVIFITLASITHVLNIAKDRYKNDDKNDKNEETTVPSVTEPVITGPTIEGIWYFNGNPELEEKITYNVSFTSDGHSYSSITTGGDGDFNMWYDEDQVVGGFAWFAQSDSGICYLQYLDFGEEQVVTDEFIEFMETYAIKVEVSGAYEFFEDSGHSQIPFECLNLSFTFDGNDYIGIAVTDQFALLISAIGDDFVIAQDGMFIDSGTIDFGETPQVVSIECWNFIYNNLTKIS